MIDKINAYKLDWDPITVEGYIEKANEVILVFNFDIRTEEKISNVIQYVVGRVAWGCKNFPPEAKIRLSFDIRGQEIIISKSDSLKQKILESIFNLDIRNQILIDFLR